MNEARLHNISAAIALVSDLNRVTKFVIMPMRGHFNVAGANAASLWQTGYPFAVDFSHGYPRYNPGETTAVDILARRECDAAFIVASDPVSNFPKAASDHLANIPTIVIDPRYTPTTEIAEVVIPAAYAGIEAEGIAYRMDLVPLRLRKLVEPPEGCLPDVEIIQAILRRVREIKRGG